MGCIEVIVLDTATLVLVATGLMIFLGFVVYMAFYEFLNKFYTRKLRSTSRLKEEVVMCGLEYDEDEISIPVSRVFTDIMRRSLPRIHYGVEKGGGTRILNDWFTWMLVFLTIMVILALVYSGW